MSKRAIIYTRVSTDEQAEKGYGLQTQLEVCRAYAKANGLEIVGEFSDDMTGSRLDRPGLEQMRTLLASGSAEAVIDHTADRLARKLSLSLILRDEFRRAGTELHHAIRGLSQETPEGDLLENIEAVFAEFERQKITERSRRGRRAKALAGNWVGAGFVPYGYRRVGMRQTTALEICEPEAAIVRRIFALVCTEHMPFRAICRLLESESVPSPALNQNRASTHWHPSTINGILGRDIYYGILTYAGKSVAAPTLALVDPAIRPTVIELLNLNKARARRNCKHDYLLAGRFKCACGATMTGVCDYVTRHQTYACIARLKRAKTQSACTQKRVRCELVEDTVWAWVYNVLSVEENLRAGLAEVRQHRARTPDPRQERVKQLQGFVSRANRQAERLTKELSLSDTDAAALVFRKEINRILSERDQWQAELAQLVADQQPYELSPDQESALIKLVATLRDRLRDAPLALKQGILDALDLRVQVRSDAAGRWLDVTCGVGGLEIPVIAFGACQSTRYPLC